MPEFLGLITQVDSSQVPFGGAVVCKNMAQLSVGRLRRIPGVSGASSAVVDAQLQIPLAFWAKGLGSGGEDQLISIFVGTTSVSIVNISTGLAMTGPAFASPVFGKPWTATFYNNKWMFAGGDNTSIYQLDSSSAYSAVTGSPSPPGGNLIQSYFNRLYVADIPGYEGLVQYSDVLSTDFDVVNLVNVKEIPGAITVLAVNSPSTDVAGIGTQLIIMKKSAIWAWDETSKDLITSAIGSLAPHSWVNTEAGLVGLGQKGNKYSVFLLPLGTAGEPLDVGNALQDVLNGTTVLANSQLAHAVQHDRFYKLFYSATGQNNNPNELWLDTQLLRGGQKILWYGPHGRGSIDASVVSDTALELFVRGASGVAKRYQENTNITAGFTGTNGLALSAELDLSLNVDPINDEKIYDAIELQVAKEANLSGNQITYEPIAEDASQGVQTLSVHSPTSSGISRVIVSLHAEGQSGMAARDARLKIIHSLNQRFDVLGASLQYGINEDEGGGRIRKQS